MGRVAAVFNNNGSGVRGDLKATVREVLFDPDAVTLASGPPGGSALFLVSPEPLYLPFKGGFMLPFPLAIVAVPLAFVAVWTPVARSIAFRVSAIVPPCR